jgi:hypothetical protein
MSLKLQTKRFLFNSGIWYKLSLMRMVPSILSWLKSGCTANAPHPVKMMVIESYLDRFAVTNFVETGTYLGETLGYIAGKNGVKCISIELSPELHQQACQKFNRHQNVTLLEGDSGERLPEVLEKITTPTVFWLDGHYSSGITAQADHDTPISAELEAILKHPIKDHIILIDDARCFDGTNNYPYLDDLIEVIRVNGGYTTEVSTDIIRIIPCTNLQN